MGASDMNDHVYTYDDMAAGQTDPDLKNFSLRPGQRGRDSGAEESARYQSEDQDPRPPPGTAPAWMKDNDDVKGGALKKENYGVYAAYWVKYLQGMKAEGITIDALTPQRNEPEEPEEHAQYGDDVRGRS